MNYSELIKALRCKRDDCEGCDLAFLDKDEGWMCRYAAKDDDAADAIEALEKQIDFIENDKTNLEADIINLEIALDKVNTQLPKRGEIVRCKECIHFTQGGWCDREFDWFPVDGNDFCSMAEKMEAQDD